MIVGESLEKRYGRKRALSGVSFSVPRQGFLLVTGPERLGEDDALAAPRRPRRRDERHPLRRRRARRPRLRRARAAPLPRADGAREPRALRASLPRARAPRAQRHAARALRPLGRSSRPRLDVLARDDAAARALPRAAPRPGARRARRAVHGPRRGGRGAARPGARRRSRASGRSSSRPTTPPASRRSRPSGWCWHERSRALRVGRRRARAKGPAARAARPRHAARRCCCSSSRRSPSSTSRFPPGRGRTRPTACSGSRSSSRRCSASRAPGRPSAKAGRSTGSCSRPATGARSGSGRRSPRSPSSRRPSSSRCRPSRSSSRPIDLVAVAGVVLASIGICAVGSLLAAMAAASRGREVILPLLFLPLAIPLVVGGVGAGISPRRRHLPARSSASTTWSSRYLRGPPSNMSSRNNLPILAFAGRRPARPRGRARAARRAGGRRPGRSRRRSSTSTCRSR